MVTDNYGMITFQLQAPNIQDSNQGLFSVSFSEFSTDYAQPITGQVTEVTCPVIDWAQP